MLALKLSKQEELDETALLHKIHEGDYKAFTTLYDTYVKDLTNYSFKFTDDIQIIEDSIHDIFVWFWNHRTDVKITYSVKAYLFKSVRTSILRRLQHNKKLTFFDTESNEDFSYCVSSEENYIDIESKFILNEKISKVLEVLTSKQKEVIYLRYYQELSFDEIAASMNLTTKACYKLMGRAISELRKTCNDLSTILVIFFLFFFLLMG